MEKPLDFRFELPRLPAGPLVEVSSTEMEKLLLKQLEEAMENPVPTLWQLAHFYKDTAQAEKALCRLRQLLQLLSDAEEQAKCLLVMGETLERSSDYPSAVAAYKQALAREPMHTWTWYFINNNLGFCLNSLGRFTLAEPYCRRAIEADPNRPDAFKNLGLALRGQGIYRDAAQCFIAATQVNAADDRAFRLLRELLEEHPELEYEFENAAFSCERAVEAAARRLQAMKPVVHRGWRKQVILFRAKVRALFRRLWTGSR